MSEPKLPAELSGVDVPARRFSIVAALLALMLGLLLGAMGTAIHRSLFTIGTATVPFGLLIGLAMTFCAGLVMRAWRGLASLLPFAAGWVIAVEALALFGPGGDVLVIDPCAFVPWALAGTIWHYLGIALLVLITFLPRRWFQDAPDETSALDNGDGLVP